jgi:hypothetical protein
MNSHIVERFLKQGTVCGQAVVFLLMAVVILVLDGCAVDEIGLVSYTSSAEVKPSESTPLGVVGSSPFPWDTVLSGASDILTGARKKAIEEKVGYHEARSFTLFRLKAARSSCEPCSEGTPERQEGSSVRAGK